MYKGEKDNEVLLIRTRANRTNSASYKDGTYIFRLKPAGEH